MGLGDEILASADAREAKQNNPTAQVVFGRKGKPRSWDKNQKLIFANNPYITRAEDVDLSKEVIFLGNFYCGVRPYIDHKKKRALKVSFKRRVVWSDYKLKKGDIFFSDEEKERIRELKSRFSDYILLHPFTKKLMVDGNKDWGWDNWHKLSESLRGDFPLVQVIGKGASFHNPKDKERLDVAKFYTSSFRDVLMLIASVKLVVTTEGGIHHSAGALNRDAVVIFGGRSSPYTLGYDFHSNMYIDIDGSPCGMNTYCEHCRKCMDMISVEMVKEKIYDTCKRNS